LLHKAPSQKMKLIDMKSFAILIADCFLNRNKLKTLRKLYCKVIN
jgi:hypothetical protein